MAGGIEQRVADAIGRQEVRCGGRGERMVGLEVTVNGVVIGRMAAGVALDAVLESLAMGDVVALRVVEAGNVAEGRERPLELKRWGAGGGRLPTLDVEQVLAWADAHRVRTGQWPTAALREVIPGTAGERWNRVDVALRKGLRGFAGKSWLVRLLAERRGARNRKALPPLTEEHIVAWAEAHHSQTGAWPTGESGPVTDEPGETWLAVEMGLCHGQRGLKEGTSLARLLAERLGKRNVGALPKLTEEMILAWADAHHAAAGSWPHGESGDVAGAPGERWRAVDRALRHGNRGLPGGSSVVKLLAAHGRTRNRMGLPKLTEEMIRV